MELAAAHEGLAGGAALVGEGRVSRTAGIKQRDFAAGHPDAGAPLLEFASVGRRFPTLFDPVVVDSILSVQACHRSINGR